MAAAQSSGTIELLRSRAQLLGPDNYRAIAEFLGQFQYVLLGEATHGTHEFYKVRAELTKLLIKEFGFNVIAWEADWPDCLRVNRYIRGSGDQAALTALSDFQRFPNWMWRNADILDLVGWLRDFNDQVPNPRRKAGIYGLDLYSLRRSMEQVVHYLDKVNPAAAREARRRYACFEDFGEDPQAYGRRASHPSLSCEQEVIQQLVELQRRSSEFLQNDGRLAEDELFYAQQNALVALNAEHYYRAMYHGRVDTWNLRDTHMVDTLDRLMEHLQSHGENPKAIVWAHNSHLGDARATQMGDQGELNVGQLVRQRHGERAVLAGFSTFEGTVTAASDWGETAERKRVRPGLPGSYEDLFHQINTPRFWLNLRGDRELREGLRKPMLERAIGVIYRPETERWSHYFQARLSDQFDVLIHIDHTRAVEPLDRGTDWDRGEAPETYPSGL